MKGRKKLPTNLKVIRGTFQKCRENKDEPKPDIRIPKPPDHISRTALVEWGRISAHLEKLGLISDSSMAALAAYCDVYSEWVEVNEALEAIAKEEGVAAKYVSKTQAGNYIQNPLIGIKHTCVKLMKDFLVEFGMTPASLGKVTPVSAGAIDPVDAWNNRTKKKK